MHFAISSLCSKWFRIGFKIISVGTPTYILPVWEGKKYDDCFGDAFVKPIVLASANSWYKLLKLDLKNESNLLSTSSVNVGFGASIELRKLKTVQHIKIPQFQSNDRKLLIKQ